MSAGRRAGADRWWLGALVALTLLSLAAVLAALVARTAIPFALDGVVVNVIERNRSPGTEFWSIELADGRRWFVDEEAAGAVRPGAIRKEAWSRHVRIGQEVHSIGLSRQLLGPALWASVTAAGTVVVLARSRGEVTAGHPEQIRPGGPPS